MCLEPSGVEEIKGRLMSLSSAKESSRFALSAASLILCRASLSSQEVDLMVFLEPVDDPVDDPVVEILAAQVGVAARGQDLEDRVMDLEHGDVESPASHIEYGHLGVAPGVHSVGQARRRRFVDHPQDVQPGDGGRVFGGLPLVVVEMGGDRDHRFGDGRTEIRLGALLEVGQDDARDLLGGDRPGIDHDDHVTVGRFAQAVRHLFARLDDLRRIELPADQPLDREDGLLGIRDRLAEGKVPDKLLSARREADDGSRRRLAVQVGNDRRPVPLQEGHAGERRAEVDADHRAHSGPPFLGTRTFTSAGLSRRSLRR